MGYSDRLIHLIWAASSTYSRWKGEYESDHEDVEPEGCAPIQDAQPKATAKAKAKGKAQAIRDASAPPKVRIEVDAPHGSCEYVPGEFRKRKKAYCRECTEEGFLNYWEALQAWNFSAERAQLLTTFPPASSVAEGSTDDVCSES